MQNHIDTLEDVVNCFRSVIRPGIKHTLPVPPIIFSPNTAALDHYVYELSNHICPADLMSRFTQLTEDLCSCLDRLPTLSFDIRLASLGVHLMLLVLGGSDPSLCHARGPLILARYMALRKDKVSECATCITQNSAELLLRLSVMGSLPNSLSWKCLFLLNKLLYVCSFLKSSLVSHLATNRQIRLAIGSILYGCNDYTCQAQALELIGACISNSREDVSSFRFNPKSLWENSQPEFLWLLCPPDVKAGDEACNKYISLITNYRKAQSLPICSSFEFHHIRLYPATTGCSQDGAESIQYGPVKGVSLTGYIPDLRMVLWIPKDPHLKLHARSSRQSLMPMEIDLNTVKSLAIEEFTVVIYVESRCSSASQYSLCTTSKSWTRAKLAVLFSEQMSADHLFKQLADKMKISRRVSAPTKTLFLRSRTPSSHHAETISSVGLGSLPPVEMVADSTSRSEQIPTRPKVGFRVSGPITDISISSKSDFWDYVRVSPTKNSPKRPKEKLKAPPSPSLSSLSPLDSPDRTPKSVPEFDKVNKEEIAGRERQTSQHRHVSIDLDNQEEGLTTSQRESSTSFVFEERLDANCDQLDQSPIQSNRENMVHRVTTEEKRSEKDAKAKWKQMKCELTLVADSAISNVETNTTLDKKNDVLFNEEQFVQTSTPQRTRNRKKVSGKTSLGSSNQTRTYSKPSVRSPNSLQPNGALPQIKTVMKSYGKRSKKRTVQGNYSRSIKNISKTVKCHSRSCQSEAPRQEQEMFDHAHQQDQREGNDKREDRDNGQSEMPARRMSRNSAESHNVLIRDDPEELLRHRLKKRKVAGKRVNEKEEGVHQVLNARDVSDQPFQNKQKIGALMTAVDNDIVRQYSEKSIQTDALNVGKQVINLDNNETSQVVETAPQNESADLRCQCNLADSQAAPYVENYPFRVQPGNNASFDIVRDVILGPGFEKGLPALFWRAGILVSERLNLYQRRLVDVQQHLEKELTKVLMQARRRRMNELKSAIEESQSKIRHACLSAIETLSIENRQASSP